MKHISQEQRYQIQAYLKAGKSKDFIAKELNVHRSTVYRETRRNVLKKGSYSAKTAQELTNERKERYFSNRKFTPTCIKIVNQYLQEDWSPKQIVGYCRNNGIAMISHERIYQHIRQDKKQNGTLYQHCRHQLKHRKRSVGKHFPIANRVSIEDRPEIVAKKERFGDWEMDTIIGANQKGAVLTITELKTNFIIIKKLPYGKNAKSLSSQVTNALHPYKNFTHTITTDNGPEFAEHLEINKKLNTTVYFAHPYCSWEKGAIEHANKLIRQYIQKEANLNDYSQAQLTEIQHKLNKRPREKLNFKSPKDIFYNFVNGNVAFDT